METQNTTDKFPFEALLRLNDMLSRIVDARRGYRQAAGHVDDYPRLKDLFERRADERDRFASELQSAVAERGKTLEQEMTLGETWNATVRSLRELFSEHPPADVLDECLATEQKAVDEYELLVEMPTVPQQIRTLLKSQRDRMLTEMADLERARTDLG